MAECCVLKSSNWTPTFAGVRNIGKAGVFVVIPAEIGIQYDEKTELLSKSIWSHL